MKSGAKCGVKPRFEWTEKFVCGREGQYCDERDPDMSPRKRHKTGREQDSVKVGCKAHFWLRKRIGSDAIEVTYRWEHTGHVVGSKADFYGSMHCPAVRCWVLDHVEDGLDWPAIKSLIRIDEDLLDRINSQQEITELPEALLVTYKDVQNTLRECLRHLAHLHPDGKKSLELWRERLEALGYYVRFAQISAQETDVNSYLFAFISPWQKKVRTSVFTLDQSEI